MDPNQQQQPAAAAAPAQPAQKDDYLDKGADAAAKKFGVKLDAKQREGITDKLRGLFEKMTGKKVPAKVSN